jgi:hypothetical protein
MPLAGKGGAAITTQYMIEPDLRPASPENGNICGVNQRLSPNSVLIPGNREHRDGTSNCKGPLLAGLSATVRGIFFEPRTAWLTWEDSNFHIPLSKNAFEMPAEFPLFWPKTRRGDFCSCKLWK